MSHPDPDLTSHPDPNSPMPPRPPAPKPSAMSAVGKMKLLRLVHLLMGVAAIASYVVEHPMRNHIWLGYAVVATMLLRLLVVPMGGGLGLQRYYPHFPHINWAHPMTSPFISKILLSGIALSLLGVTATGLAMDGGRGLSQPPIWSLHKDRDGEQRATASDDDDDDDAGRGAVRGRHGHEDDGEDEGEEAEGILPELHELFAHMMLITVALHVVYLLAFKRALALFMLFVSTRSGRV